MRHLINIFPDFGVLVSLLYKRWTQHKNRTSTQDIFKYKKCAYHISLRDHILSIKVKHYQTGNQKCNVFLRYRVSK